MLGQLGYSLKWHHSSENFPMSSLLGENYPKPPKISLCVHFQLNSPVQNCSKRTPSSAQICHLRSFQKRFFWNTVAKNWAWSCYLRPLQKQFLCHLVTQMHEKLTFTQSLALSIFHKYTRKQRYHAEQWGLSLRWIVLPGFGFRAPSLTPTLHSILYSSSWHLKYTWSILPHLPHTAQ